MDGPGWSSGNALALIVTGTGERVAEAYEGDQAGAPLLHVEYIEASQSSQSSQSASLVAGTASAGVKVF